MFSLAAAQPVGLGGALGRPISAVATFRECTVARHGEGVGRTAVSWKNGRYFGGHNIFWVLVRSSKVVCSPPRPAVTLLETDIFRLPARSQP